MKKTSINMSGLLRKVTSLQRDVEEVENKLKALAGILQNGQSLTFENYVFSPSSKGLSAKKLLGMRLSTILPVYETLDQGGRNAYSRLIRMEANLCHRDESRSIGTMLRFKGGATHKDSEVWLYIRRQRNVGDRAFSILKACFVRFGILYSDGSLRVSLKG